MPYVTQKLTMHMDISDNAVWSIAMLLEITVKTLLITHHLLRNPDMPICLTHNFQQLIIQLLIL